MILHCNLCGFTADIDKPAMADHIATEHPEQWEMAVQVIAMQLIGPTPEKGNT